MAVQLVRRVTVVTAVYNAAQYITETIESVLAQTYSDFDYVIVDDGSTDGTSEIIARYAPRVMGIRQENAGAGAARNRGFACAHGDYVAIVDADDIWEPDKLASQVLAMDSDPTAGLCYTGATIIRDDGSTIAPLPTHPRSHLTCLMVMTGRNPIVTSSVLYRRALLEPRPFLDIPGTEDLHVHLKVLWRSGERSVYVATPLVRYRVVSTSVTSQLEAWQRGRITLKAIQAFIDDMRLEKPLPPRLQRQAIAYAHFLWAWYCIDAQVAGGFALREMLRSLLLDYTLAPRVARQLTKMCVQLADFR